MKTILQIIFNLFLISQINALKNEEKQEIVTKGSNPWDLLKIEEGLNKIIAKYFISKKKIKGVEYVLANEFSIDCNAKKLKYQVIEQNRRSKHFGMEEFGENKLKEIEIHKPYSNKVSNVQMDMICSGEILEIIILRNFPELIPQVSKLIFEEKEQKLYFININEQTPEKQFLCDFPKLEKNQKIFLDFQVLNGLGEILIELEQFSSNLSLTIPNFLIKEMYEDLDCRITSNPENVKIVLNVYQVKRNDLPFSLFYFKSEILVKEKQINVNIKRIYNLNQKANISSEEIASCSINNLELSGNQWEFQYYTVEGIYTKNQNSIFNFQYEKIDDETFVAFNNNNEEDTKYVCFIHQTRNSIEGRKVLMIRVGEEGKIKQAKNLKLNKEGVLKKKNYEIPIDQEALEKDYEFDKEFQEELERKEKIKKEFEQDFDELQKKEKEQNLNEREKEKLKFYKLNQLEFSNQQPQEEIEIPIDVQQELTKSIPKIYYEKENFILRSESEELKCVLIFKDDEINLSAIKFLKIVNYIEDFTSQFLIFFKENQSKIYKNNQNKSLVTKIFSLLDYQCDAYEQNDTILLFFTDETHNYFRFLIQWGEKLKFTALDNNQKQVLTCEENIPYSDSLFRFSISQSKEDDIQYLIKGEEFISEKQNIYFIQNNPFLQNENYVCGFDTVLIKMQNLIRIRIFPHFQKMSFQYYHFYYFDNQIFLYNFRLINEIPENKIIKIPVNFQVLSDTKFYVTHAISFKSQFFQISFLEDFFQSQLGMVEYIRDKDSDQEREIDFKFHYENSNPFLFIVLKQDRSFIPWFSEILQFNYDIITVTLYDEKKQNEPKILKLPEKNKPFLNYLFGKTYGNITLKQGFEFQDGFLKKSIAFEQKDKIIPVKNDYSAVIIKHYLPKDYQMDFSSQNYYFDVSNQIIFIYPTILSRDYQILI